MTAKKKEKDNTQSTIKFQDQNPNLDLQQFQDNMDNIFLEIYLNPRYSYSKYVGMGIKKQMDLSCDTAYVGYNREKNEIFLGYNPYFLAQYNKKRKTGVIAHEYLHVIFEHLTLRSTNNPKERMLLNIAQDLAINSIVGYEEGHLPDICFLPGEPLKDAKDKKFSEFIEKLPKMEDSEFYFEQLLNYFKDKKTVEEIILVIGGSGTMDDHNIWDDIPEHLKDAINEKIEQALKEGIEEAKRTKNWGSIPLQVQQMLENMFAKVLDWESIVKNFLDMSRTSSAINTFRRLNKRMPYDLPGAKRKRQPKFLFAIDQSGSMSDEDVRDGVTLVLDLLGAKKAEVDLVNFDTEIDESSFVRNIKKDKAFKWGRTRSGGTDFDCLRRYINKPENRKQFSGLIIYSDGYANQMGQVLGPKVLWLITKTGDLNVDAARSGDLIVQIGERKLKRK